MLRAVPDFVSGFLSGAFLVASSLTLLLVVESTPGRPAAGPLSDTGVETGRGAAPHALRRPTVPRGDYTVQSLRPPVRVAEALPRGGSFGAPVLGGAVARETAVHPYRMVVPRSAGRSLPFLVLLAPPGLEPDPLAPWTGLAGHAGFAVLAPQMEGVAWRSPAGARSLLEAMLVDAVRRNGLAPGPLYLHGEGAAAGAALDLANAEPHLWRAVSVHGQVSGVGPVRPQDRPLPDVAIFVGAATRRGTLEAAHDTAAALAAAGHGVMVMEIERHDGREERLGAWLPARIWAHLRSR